MSQYKDWKTKDKIIKTFSESVMSSQPILSNEMKDGDFILQYNGWYGEIVDNARGNTRMANIHGSFVEAGSVYVWDIDLVCKDGLIHNLQLTPKQEKDKVKIENQLRDIW